MYKVLVFGMTENPGGVESVIINYYRNIDRNKIQFDFLCNFHEDAAYENELKALGGKVFHITARSDNYHRYREELENFFRNSRGNYQAIWVNICSLANIDYLILAKKYGIPRRIIHSHNSQNMDSRLRGMLHKFNRNRIAQYATDFWSCSEDSARWFYRDSLLPNVVMIRNAISVSRMEFCREKREAYRGMLGCNSGYVIGNIGRLHFQKNQQFCLEIFRELLERESDARLVLIGQGEDESLLKARAEELGVDDKVYFAGTQNDIAGWLSAFDIFLFPSKFEGLPIAALEAQANGLPVLASAEVIPEAVKINHNFKFYELNKSAAQWSEQLLQMRQQEERENPAAVRRNFISRGYDIETEAKKLEELFLKDAL